MPSRKSAGDGWSFRPAHREDAPREVESLPPDRQRVRITLEKRKKGKVVTRVHELELARDDLQSLARALKSSCGVGGTIADGGIELQGDCRERARSWLESHGWRFA